MNDQGLFDVYSMGAKIDDVLSMLNPEQNNKNGMGDPLNQKNCGGYPVGTIITDTSEGCLSTITNVYECQVYNGQANWYITSTTTEAGLCLEP